MSATKVVTKILETCQEDKKQACKILSLLTTFSLSGMYPRSANDDQWQERVLELDKQVMNLSDNKLSGIDLIADFVD
jgi:hypothetical protein